MVNRRKKRGRFRNILGLAILAMAVPPIILLAKNINYQKGPPPPEKLLEASLTSDEPSDRPAVQEGEKRGLPVEIVVKSGSNAYTLLVEAGLAPQEAIALAGAFSPLADLSRCRPGEVFTLVRKPGGVVSSVTYRKGPLKIYEARRDDEGWEAFEKFVPYSLRAEKITGRVESSLFEALNLQGEKDSLALSLLDILAWEMDFAHDARKGDRFSIFVEKYYVDGQFVEYGPILAASYATAERNIDAYSLENDRGFMDYFDEQGRSLRKSFLKSPLRYNRITSSYTGRRLHPITRRVQPHYAIDYAAPRGTPVWAVADGTIRSLSYDRANGRMVRIIHPGGYETFYLHLSGYARGLKRGQKVGQKQIIGYVGTTGMATGPHLDYRLKKRGRYTNPLREDFPRAEPVTKSRREEFLHRVTWLGPVLEDASSGQMAQASPQISPSKN